MGGTEGVTTYVMNLFKFPAKLIHELHHLCAQFWWDGDDTKREMHRRSWIKLCYHKHNGRPVFHNIFFFNQALHVKQAWRLHNATDSFARRVIKGFYHKSSFVQAKKSQCSSISSRIFVLITGFQRSGNASYILLWEVIILGWLLILNGLPMSGNMRLLKLAFICSNPKRSWLSHILSEILKINLFENIMNQVNIQLKVGTGVRVCGLQRSYWSIVILVGSFSMMENLRNLNVPPKVKSII